MFDIRVWLRPVREAALLTNKGTVNFCVGQDDESYPWEGRGIPFWGDNEKK